MITVDDIKNGYLMKILANITEYNFNIVTDTGEYREPLRQKNVVTSYVNGVFSLQSVDFQQLNDGRVAAGFEFLLKFTLPLDDRTPLDGTGKEYKTLIDFRQKLSDKLAGATLVEIEKDGKTYVGGAMFNLPMPNANAIRQHIGKSIEYSCTIALALLDGGVNTSKLALSIDGVKVPFTGIKITRTPTLSADLMSKSKNDESTVYAESTQFKIEFSMPAVSDNCSSAVMLYILGVDDGNKPHMVKVEVKDKADWTTEKAMIFGGCEVQGSGMSNLLYSVSLVPYTAPETVGG